MTMYDALAAYRALSYFLATLSARNDKLTTLLRTLLMKGKP